MKLFLASMAILFVQAVGAQNFNVLRFQQMVLVYGKLTPESVARVVTEIRRDPTQKLIINSSGGDVAAAMQLGSVVRELDLDVEVREACVSSCANCVFSAGRKKQVADGAFVVWHGSLMQKDLRDMVERYRLLSPPPALRRLAPLLRRTPVHLRRCAGTTVQHQAMQMNVEVDFLPLRWAFQAHSRLTPNAIYLKVFHRFKAD